MAAGGARSRCAGTEAVLCIPVLSVGCPQVGEAARTHLQAAQVEIKAYEAFVGDVEAAVHAGRTLWADASKARPA